MQTGEVVFETDRLRFRKMTVRDLDLLYRLEEPKEIRKFVNTMTSNREEEQDKLSAYIYFMYGFYGFGHWFVEEKETGNLIGRMGLGFAEYIKEFDGELDLGYLVLPEYQKKGYALEGCKAILEYAKEDMEVEVITAYMHSENEASKRLLEKLGFEKREAFLYENRSMERYLLEY